MQLEILHYDGRRLLSWWVYSPDQPKTGRYNVWEETSAAARLKIERYGKRVVRVEPRTFED